MKKWLSNIISWLLTILIVLFIGISAIAIVSRKNNNGVAKVFDYSFMHVITDSMEPEYKVGTGIIVKSVNYHDLKIDDDIAFFKVANNMIIVVMHRIIAIDTSKEPYVFTTQGINLDSDQCSNRTCLPDLGIMPDNILGKVVNQSSGLGFLLKSFQNRIVQLVLILIPLAGAVAYAFVNLVQLIRKKDEDDDDESDEKKEEAQSMEAMKIEKKK